MLSLDKITQEALSLPNNLRVELVEKLIESLEIDVDESLQKTWLNIAKKRRNDLRNGEVIPIAGDVALAQIREIIEP
jgi:uncharacterized metal-binding protein